MVFDPGLKKNEVIDNNDLCSIFMCGPQGGMRRSHKTNTLVIVSDHTKDLYGDRWENGVLHYTGMGQYGDQDINFGQNPTLAGSQTNGVKVHLLEVLKTGQYTYRGEVKLADKPYKGQQKDKDGITRLVWIFPVQVI